MKKKNFLYLAALSMVAAACSNEDDSVLIVDEPAPAARMITETVTATNGDNQSATRAAIGDDAAFTWSDGDLIAVRVSDGKYYTTEALPEGEGGQATAAFTVSYSEEGVREGFAVFPASIVAADATGYGQEGAALDVTLPGSYTLAEVSGTTTPCPMIATNNPGEPWEFKQLCGLLRLTVNGIPEGTAYLQLDFNGMQVCGDFSIAAPEPGTSTIATAAITSASASNACDKIKITELGGATSAVINLPLPTGQYNGLTVAAVTSSNVKVGELSFTYEAKRAKGKKASVDLPDTSIAFMPGTALNPSSSVEHESIVGFEFKDDETVLSGLRFVRIISEDNKVQATYKVASEEAAYGPITVSRSNDETDPLPQTLYLGLRFDETASSHIVVQAIDADGNVYSGSTAAPVSFKNGYYYKKTVSVPVKSYTFTVRPSMKVSFAPGDLGVDNGVYSFTDPFVTWGWKEQYATKRVWFNYNEMPSQVYGVTWRLEGWTNNSSLTTEQKYEWNYLIGRSIAGGAVATYYHVQIGSTYCLLLPPDEAVADDVAGLTSGSTITDYAKYLGKGFVLLMNTGYANALTSTWKWGNEQQGWYWSSRNTSNRYYFKWAFDGTPVAEFFGNQARMRARLVHEVK